MERCVMHILCVYTKAGTCETWRITGAGPCCQLGIYRLIKLESNSRPFHYGSFLSIPLVS